MILFGSTLAGITIYKDDLIMVSTFRALEEKSNSVACINKLLLLNEGASLRTLAYIALASFLFWCMFLVLLVLFANYANQ